MVINGLTNNGESWNDMGLPFGNLLQFAIENDHRHSWFTHWKYPHGDFPVRYVNVYQRVDFISPAKDYQVPNYYT